ncbi:MAG: hypothetical protein NDJ65_00165, partial [Paludibacteraceae bacterium]|nr:hypothetical protein [Paludibacteraceae bacterium]
MKNLRFLLTMALAISTMAFVSCSDDDKDSNKDNNSTNPSGAISAFFPEGYSASNVAAWYLYSEVQQDGTKRASAVFLFNNNTILVTYHKIKSDGREYKEIDFEGTYQITNGNYDNGTAYVPQMGMSVTIQNGKMTPMGEETFTKQSNANIPAASKPVDGEIINGGGSGDGDGNGGDNGAYAITPEAYLPSSYASKTIAAWYGLTEIRDTKTRNQAIFLFNDGSMVVTKSTVYTKADGRNPEYSIEFAGTYEITSGDYSNGAAYVPEMSMTVTISNGVLSVPAMQETYTKQSNADAPAPKK